jgi:hypothetical protein
MIPLRRVGSWFVVLGCLLAIPAGAQSRIRYDTTTVEQRILLTPDLTPAQARRTGIEEALAEAVRQVSGVQVRSGVVSVKEEQAGRIRDDYISVVQLDAAGRATSYEVVSEGWTTTRHPELGEQVYLRMVVRATIATELTPADDAFQLEAWVSSAVLRVRGRDSAANDELVVSVRPTMDSHLGVFSLVGDSARMVFPNDYVRDVVVSGRDSVDVPTPEWRARGLRLRAELPAGVDERRELVVAIAGRDPLPSYHGSTVMDFQRWVLTIPADRRAMKWVVVETRRQ